MRLQFRLNKIKIDPVCHIQIVRHAQQFNNRTNIYGQLYGALYEDEAEVTSIMPLPEGEKSTKQQLEAMQKRNDESLSQFNLDSEKIGWYMVCYKRNFWDSLETMKYYENYINTSFFIVFDYKNRELGKNPYRAYRLKDDFAIKESFKWQDLQKCNLQIDNPFEEIKVEVRKNELFELLMMYNKDSMLRTFQKEKKDLKNNSFSKIKVNIDQYTEAFKQMEQIQRYFNENHLKNADSKMNQGQEKQIPFNDYSEYIGQAFKLQNYENYFRKYHKDNEKIGLIFEQE